jgi:hypothetical protein
VTLPPEDRFVAELLSLSVGTPRVVLEMDVAQAWLLFAGLQLALRHPDVPPDTRQSLTEIAERLQEVVAPRTLPALAAVAAAGWDQAQDQPAVSVDQVLAPLGGGAGDPQLS